jgi:hypothetical protein
VRTIFLNGNIVFTWNLKQKILLIFIFHFLCRTSIHTPDSFLILFHTELISKFLHNPKHNGHVYSINPCLKHEFTKVKSLPYTLRRHIGRLEVQFRSILNSALDVELWSASRYCRFNSGKSALGFTRWLEAGQDSQLILWITKKSGAVCWELNQSFLVAQLASCSLHRLRDLCIPVSEYN